MAEIDDLLGGLTRPQRLFLKRAWAASERKPFFPVGSASARVMKTMCQKGYVRTVGYGAVLTPAGHKCAVRLSALGWPNCEKSKALKEPDRAKGGQAGVGD